MTHQASGKLFYSDVKGLHHVDAPWWIDIGLTGHAFRLESHSGGQPSHLDSLGRLHAAPGYLWDGSSGPTVDGKADPVPSLVHDLLYEALRSGRLPKRLRGWADALYRELLIKRGMGKPRAWLRWAGLRVGGSWSASRTRGPQYPKRSAA